MIQGVPHAVVTGAPDPIDNEIPRTFIAKSPESNVKVTVDVVRPLINDKFKKRPMT